jgi:CheY-specific phosphatase CheX
MPEPTRLLEEALNGALEGLAFIFPTVEEKAQATSPHNATVTFRGPVSGAIRLQLDDDAIGLIATSMLGTEEMPEPAVRQDALGELVNVTTGNLLRSIATPSSVYNLSVPSADAAFPAMTAVACVQVSTDPGAVRAVLYLEDPQALA